MQQRYLNQRTAQVRVAKRDDGAKVICGYGAVFYNAADPGSEYRLYDDVFERIMPGAFDRALKEKDDVRGLFNHDPSCLLGRTSAGTMQLIADKKGLWYEITTPDTQWGRDTITSIERGDLTGSSFAFVATEVAWVQAGLKYVREIHECRLWDTGPVSYPAYQSATTSVGGRQ